MQKFQKRLNAIQRDFLLKQKDSVNKWAISTGIPYASMNEFFNYKSYLNVANLERLCEVAGISIDNFLSMGKENKTNKSK